MVKAEPRRILQQASNFQIQFICPLSFSLLLLCVIFVGPTPVGVWWVCRPSYALNNLLLVVYPPNLQWSFFLVKEKYILFSNGNIL